MAHHSTDGESRGKPQPRLLHRLHEELGEALRPPARRMLVVVIADAIDHVIALRPLGPDRIELLRRERREIDDAEPSVRRQGPVRRGRLRRTARGGDEGRRGGERRGVRPFASVHAALRHQHGRMASTELPLKPLKRADRSGCRTASKVPRPDQGPGFAGHTETHRPQTTPVSTRTSS